MKKKCDKIKEKEEMQEEKEILIEDVENEELTNEELSTEDIEESEEEKTETELLEEEVEKMTKERNEFKDKWLRSLAEFDNFRKNTLKEKQDWISYANEKILLEICEVFDNFERAFDNEVTEHNFEAYHKGIQLIYQQIESLLKKNNIERIESLEKEFDPNYHEALAHIPSELNSNIIAAVIQNGYRLKEKVIRPARVAVSNGNKPEVENEKNK